MKLHVGALEFPRAPRVPKSPCFFSYLRDLPVFTSPSSLHKKGVTRCVWFLASAPPRFQTWVDVHKAQLISWVQTSAIDIVLSEDTSWTNHSGPWLPRVTCYLGSLPLPCIVHFATQQFPPNPVNRCNCPREERT